jgi:methylated-DNA-protein-cysteine methyltransferase-like protein
MLPEVRMDFTETVFEVVRCIPAGRVATYGDVARWAGSPGAARRVGWALNRSAGVEPPVPAHRVVNRWGGLTGAVHFPGPGGMEALLTAEGVATEGGRVLHFAAVRFDPASDICTKRQGTKTT